MLVGVCSAFFVPLGKPMQQDCLHRVHGNMHHCWMQMAGFAGTVQHCSTYTVQHCSVLELHGCMQAMREKAAEMDIQLPGCVAAAAAVSTPGLGRVQPQVRTRILARAGIELQLSGTQLACQESSPTCLMLQHWQPGASQTAATALGD